MFNIASNRPKLGQSRNCRRMAMALTEKTSDQHDLSEAMQVVTAALPRATSIKFEMDLLEDRGGLLKTAERLIIELRADPVDLREE
jgi:hypothetical protein